MTIDKWEGWRSGNTRLVFGAVRIDGFDLDLADEGPRGVTECSVAFGKSAQAGEFALHDFFADQFEAVTERDKGVKP